MQFLRPEAASSGIPELMAFLNGTIVRHIFNVKTLVIKFLSCITAVSSGLPVGPEGPMIHMGSVLSSIDNSLVQLELVLIVLMLHT